MKLMIPARKKSGFTLIELMVVIVIIIIMAGIAIPTVLDFMRSRRLKGAGNQIQAACMRARSRAIAQRERQYLIFYVQNDATSTRYDTPDSSPEDWDTPQPTPLPTPPEWDEPSGRPNSIHAWDSNDNAGVAREKTEEDPIMYLPEFTRLTTPATNFGLTFRADGTIRFYGIANSAVDPDDGTATDIVITQTNSDMACYVDIAANTGRVRFAIK